MQIALIYPPTCDPTAPYISIPILSAYLRSYGVEVFPFDANAEAYDFLFKKNFLDNCSNKLESKLHNLEKRSSLTHQEQLEYHSLWSARGLTKFIPNDINKALCVFRNQKSKQFFSPNHYEKAVFTIEGALKLISAAYTPLALDFLSYRTPFSLLSIKEIERDSIASRNPFYDYFLFLIESLSVIKPKIVGLSVAFQGQVQPAYSLAFLLKKYMPNIHITVGGPAITQIFLRLKDDNLKKALKPFDTAILFEGETALLQLCQDIDTGKHPSGIILGKRVNLSNIPEPDFEGMPLEKYLSPSLVLPYDAARGCYWGKCAFCHYGLAESGTAPYQERPIDDIISHLSKLSSKYKCKIFYLSQDTIALKTAHQIAANIHEQGLNIKWSTDIRPEPDFSPAYCKELSKGGALSIALGIESASPRVLKLINKGVKLSDLKNAVINIGDAGIAVEVMCFTDFPTESYKEAFDTLNFLKEHEKWIALFICGQFGLVHGSRVAKYPEKYGIKKIWHAAGDEFLTGIFYDEAIASKTYNEQKKIDNKINDLSKKWWLHKYPWAGSLSTSHSLLWYERFGSNIFKQMFGNYSIKQPVFSGTANFDLEKIAEISLKNESLLWHKLIRQKRKVTRKAYNELAEKLPLAKRRFI
ncbi:MAG: radical SAM protein [Desulfobacterales bacterium]|nr:radical SAM protein [Desulfobacterales bacterium]